MGYLPGGTPAGFHWRWSAWWTLPAERPLTRSSSASSFRQGNLAEGRELQMHPPSGVDDDSKRPKADDRTVSRAAVTIDIGVRLEDLLGAGRR